MLEAPAVDVSRSDLGHLYLGLRNRQPAAAVMPAGQTGQSAGAVPPAQDDLSVALTVHTQVPAGLFHQTVGLAGDHEGIFSQADVEALAAAPQGQQQLPRGAGGVGHDPYRAFETTDGPPERFGRPVPRRQVPRNQGGDELGVRGDPFGHRKALGDNQLGLIVDVAVEGADDIRPRGSSAGLVRIERVGVGFRN